MTTDHNRFWEIIEGMTACMVTTTDGDVLRSRPMAPFIDTEKRTIHFVTDSDSAKIFEITQDQDIVLNFADQSKMVFASVSAKAMVNYDRDLIKRLWGPYCDVFFGGDAETADVAVIKAAPVQAEYWDNDKSKLAIAAEMTRAYFADDGPDLGENAKLDF